MTNVASLSSVAALIGDPARAAMLVLLMDGRALTAGELARAAGVAPPTASGHLGRMLDGGLLALERQGRHRYYRISSPTVAGLVESLMSVSSELSAAADRCKPVRTGPRDRDLRRSRLCYDHLAGGLAVAMTDRMVARGELELGADGGIVTDKGLALLAALDVAVDGGGAAFRPCLDWSERRPHVGGALGRALFESFVRQGWVRRASAGRAVFVTPRGSVELSRHFGDLFGADGGRG